MKTSHLMSLTIVALVIYMCSGCAVFNRRNTPTVNWVDQHLAPQKKPAKYIAMPLIVPVGLVAGVTDMLIVHPVTVVDDAAGDAKDAFWDDFEWEKHYVTECSSLLPRSVGTVIFFPFDFLGRSSFDIEPRGVTYGGTHYENEQVLKAQADQAAKLKCAYQLTVKAEEAFREGEFEDAASLADEAVKQWRIADATLFTSMTVPFQMEKWERSICRTAQVRLAAAGELGRTKDFLSLLTISNLSNADESVAASIEQHVELILREGAPPDQMTLLYIISRNHCRTLGPIALGHAPKLLAAQDRALAQRVVDFVGKMTSEDGSDVEVQSARHILESVANSEDSVLAAAASMYLQQVHHAQ